MTVELWLRPWAMAELQRRHRVPLSASAIRAPDGHRAALWIYSSEKVPVLVDGHEGRVEPVPGFALAENDRILALMPMPLRRHPPAAIALPAGQAQLSWPAAPERPPDSLEPKTEEEQRAHAVMLRAETVWDRIFDVESALADPARLWDELRRRWTTVDEDTPPAMDVIVHHARDLPRTLDDLERRPRRILRRTNARLPVGRVQEVDRRSMLWLARQPGETLAERAGDDQRVLAVTRQENFDTLENRVLHAYGDLVVQRVRDYLERNVARKATARARRVQDFGRQCARLSRNLAQRGVGRAEAGVMPNFVLQENVSYRRVWAAWQELLRQKQLQDDLWRWQARSWEEFCALGAMVALSGLPGARLIASAPLGFRDEQVHGSWLEHDNPIGVFHLAEQSLVFEVRYRMQSPDRRLADFGAPIWLRVGRIGEVTGFLTNIAVWPIWDADGGLVDGEVEEIADLLPLGRQAHLTGGVVIRPVPPQGEAESRTAGNAMVLTLGTDGAPLRQGIAGLEGYFASRLADRGSS